MTWIVWRWLKFVALAIFASGLWSSACAQDRGARLTAAHWTTTAGLVLSWIAGYALMKTSGRGFEPWVLQAMGASLVASTGALLAASRPRPALGAGLAAAGFCAASFVMVSRGALALGWALGLSAALGALASLAASRLPDTDADLDPDLDLGDRHLRWFTWVARFEGASLLLMVGVSMPLRMLASIELDGGQGWIGWVHGILVLIYLQALVAVAIAQRWGLGRTSLAFVASLLPGGTFVFERRVLARPRADQG